MKKHILVCIAVTFSILGVSCKKDYTCTCRATIPEHKENGITLEAVDSTVVLTYHNTKKKDADTRCSNEETIQHEKAKPFNGSVSCDLSKK